MLSYRTRKKAAYALLAALVLSGLLAYPVWRLVRQIPTPAPTVSYRPIEIKTVGFVSHARGIDLVAELYNPNPRAGLPEVPVEFILLGADGRERGRHTVVTYLSPGATTYANAVNVPLTGIASLEVTLPPNPSFKAIPENVTLPSFSVFLREQTVKKIGDQTINEQKGVVRNTSTLDWQRVEISALAKGDAGAVRGISQTFVGELKVNEEREFTLQWPLAPERVIQVVALPNTNVYREENIVKILGNPSLLR